MAKILYKLTKIYADGHIWTETVEELPREMETLFDEDPSLVTVLLTRNIRRDGQVKG